MDRNGWRRAQGLGMGFRYYPKISQSRSRATNGFQYTSVFSRKIRLKPLAAQESRANYEKHGRDAENLSDIQKHLGSLTTVESMWKTVIPNKQNPSFKNAQKLSPRMPGRAENPNISNHRSMPLKKITDIWGHWKVQNIFWKVWIIENHRAPSKSTKTRWCLSDSSAPPIIWTSFKIQPNELRKTSDFERFWTRSVHFGWLVFSAAFDFEKSQTCLKIRLLRLFHAPHRNRMPSHCC